MESLIISFQKGDKNGDTNNRRAGFIGSCLAEMLAKKNEVIVLDNLDSYYDARIKEKNIKIVESKGAEFIIGDITNYDSIEKMIKENSIKIIFHETAKPEVRYSIKDPFLLNKANVICALNILKASSYLDIKKVINASSSSAYGKVKHLPKQSKFLRVMKSG